MDVDQVSACQSRFDTPLLGSFTSFQQPLLTLVAVLGFRVILQDAEYCLDNGVVFETVIEFGQLRQLLEPGIRTTDWRLKTCGVALLVPKQFGTLSYHARR